MTTLTYHTGSDSSAVVNVRDSNGAVVDFTTATRFVVSFYGTDTANNFAVDTDITAGVVTGDALGNLTFVFAALELTEDTYMMNLVVYDASHTNGQQLADECCGPYLCMKVCGSVPITICAALPVGVNAWESIAAAGAETSFDFIRFGNGVFLLAGTGLAPMSVSTDNGVSFAAVDISAFFWDTNDACYSATDGRWLVAGGIGRYMVSDDDGITWDVRTDAGTTDFLACHYANGLYVMVGGVGGGASGVIYTSPDADTWTSRTSNIVANKIAQDVTYGNGIWVVVSADGTFGDTVTSTDGITWVEQDADVADVALYSVDFGNGVFMAVGLASSITTSADGITWSKQDVSPNQVPPFPLQASSRIKTVIYIPTQTAWIIAGWDSTGDDTEMASSQDNGVTWHQIASPGSITQARGMAFGNDWLLAGSSSGTPVLWRTQLAL